jgi:NADH:ubiquinone oxidoreductase subunit F (NADH-binding)
VIRASDPRRLFDGPAIDGRPETLGSHVARLGAVPRPRDPRALIDEIERAGLLGRGGAGFPVGRKWRALADRRRGRAVVVANGAEGEPASAKDRVLMANRPHLVVDGALLAAEAVDAQEVVFYVGSEHTAAVGAMRQAIAQRRAETRRALRLVTAPVGYVAGEASAAVHYIDSEDARPTTTPPRMSEHGVGGLPTLVQNVESLAYAALIARFGAGWYRTTGRYETKGTALLTISGPIGEGGVREIEIGTTLREVIDEAGGLTERLSGVVLGGYFGTWARADEVLDLPLDPHAMRTVGLTFGCGMVGLLPEGSCAVEATAGIMGFMAGQSAGQCGPCLFGLRAIGETVAKVAACRADADAVTNLERWTALVAGRGACRHPDGAAQLMASALAIFGDDFEAHAYRGRCLVREAAASSAPRLRLVSSRQEVA